MLTKSDLLQIENLIDRKLEEKLEEKLNEKLAFLPTKDEFYSKMDEVVGELQLIRDELTVSSHHISQHEDRLTSLEDIHPSGKHAAI